MEESTSIPTPKASPPSDMMLRVTSDKFNGAKVIKILIGMLKATMRVLLISLRNRNRTMTASRPPMMAVCLTSRILFSMKIDRSATTSRRAPSSLNNRAAMRSGNMNDMAGFIFIIIFMNGDSSPFSIFPTLRATASETATILASASLYIST